MDLKRLQRRCQSTAGVRLAGAGLSGEGRAHISELLVVLVCVFWSEVDGLEHDFSLWLSSIRV